MFLKGIRPVMLLLGLVAVLLAVSLSSFDDVPAIGNKPAGSPESVRPAEPKYSDPTCAEPSAEVRTERDRFVQERGLQPATSPGGLVYYEYVVPETGPAPVVVRFVPPPGNGTSVCGFTAGPSGQNGGSQPAGTEYVEYLDPDRTPTSFPTPAHFCVGQRPPVISFNRTTGKSKVILYCDWVMK